MELKKIFKRSKKEEKKPDFPPKHATQEFNVGGENDEGMFNRDDFSASTNRTVRIPLDNNGGNVSN